MRALCPPCCVAVRPQHVLCMQAYFRTAIPTHLWQKKHYNACISFFILQLAMQLFLSFQKNILMECDIAFAWFLKSARRPRAPSAPELPLHAGAAFPTRDSGGCLKNATRKKNPCCEKLKGGPSSNAMPKQPPLKKSYHTGSIRNGMHARPSNVGMPSRACMPLARCVGLVTTNARM